MSHEVPSTGAGGSKDGRQWSNKELFTFLGFLNDERNDGTLQNTTFKFMAPTLKRASSFMKDKFPQRNWKYDSTLRSQFHRIRDDWRIFKEILDASGTEWNETTASFDLSDAQRDGFAKKFGYRGSRIIDSGILMNEHIGIETYANIFCDEPDAGRDIFENDDIILLDLTGDTEDIPAIISASTAHNPTNTDLNEPPSLAIRSPKLPKIAAAQTKTPRASRVSKATRKKTPSTAASRAVGTIANTANVLANARLRQPETQDSILAFANVEESGFSGGLTLAILRWLRKDPRNNPLLWNTLKSPKTKLDYLSMEPGFENVEFPVL
ncbi:hypothetical protein E4U11_005630 [Claviceps purpurea]|nr:hypothetical protein E4U11_005630 [Claviceps purpurea]